MNNVRMLPICFVLFFIMRTTTSLDTIVPGQSIKYNETIVSAKGAFELGFFRPGISKSLYVGIWYKDSPSMVVWVANRESPLNNTHGVLQINDQGVLVLLNGTKSTIWSSNITGKAENPIAQLLDSGNLVVRNGHDNNLDNLLWQSFDYPCDTLLQGMKLGWNLETGLNRFLSSWKSSDDPGKGDNIARIELQGYPQLVQLKGNVIKQRAGHWNGLSFTGSIEQKPNSLHRDEFVFNEKEVFYQYEFQNSSVFSRYVLSTSGIGQILFWTTQTSNWDVVSITQADQCSNYSFCGAYSICNFSNNAPFCACLKGFVPKHPEEWNVSHWSNGCIRHTPLDCSNDDGFMKYTGLKLPDTSSSWYNKTMDLMECKKSCLKNCSCTAYANLDIRGSGCLLWFDNLMDMSQFSQGGQDLYVRVHASDIVPNITNEFDGNNNKQRNLILIIVPISFLTLLVLVSLFVCRVRRQRRKGEDLLHFEDGMSMKVEDSEFTEANKGAKVKKDVKLPLFSFASVSAVTNNFLDANKLGEGGFGPVYKGKLLNGDEVAVKRLSQKSGQGWEELKTEALLIAKLQHNNLVRLLGCCIDHNEKMLIYEFMPNKSLDCFLFDATKRSMLDWGTRIRIIDGIAQGLLYLHQYSRFRIIHRDLKASNILLDINLNPKISDFGMARIFGENELQANTNRIVGTYGYMSPEYALNGLYSIKSDVFSFGVLLLEIVSGKKNTDFYLTDSFSLLGYAWDLWTSNMGMDLMDPILEDISNKHEVARYVNIGLLCVQENPADRPTMSDVVSMIGNDTLFLPLPKPPAFLNIRGNENSRLTRNMEENYSANFITDSGLEAR